MINCLIIDDEPLAQNVLEHYINAYEQLNLIKKCSTVLEAFEVLHLHDIQLIFLDIKLPSISGIDFIKTLKNPPAVIFTTAYSEYAVQSYELDAIDYLLKPITLERFNRSMERVLKQQPRNEQSDKTYTYFKASGKLLKVEHHELYYAQSVKDYILLHTLKGNIITYMTMKHLEELLPADQFLRVHRSYLININYLTSVEKNRLYVNQIPISIGGSSYKEKIKERIK
ncbi:LytR/AlgR family response regulator transcription factor [Pedobacter montanisoli]|uniref:LytTR family DNA-binding domain-containing protein n=1 Tax=Pedobacter montanisoli TaxID=2923277 RepID=A0ABS9ZWI1_9SPHI|nr:LytTR family DNA-binding domain-containing protein [Pedobacter montanisoli]MCJ0742671.1 LytTR family DNA-binding domain-containing protein [Pedobacter montanisoli]